jgi:pimeloyl-ACP methyl ester carboxylesterase
MIERLYLFHRGFVFYLFGQSWETGPPIGRREPYGPVQPRPKAFFAMSFFLRMSGYITLGVAALILALGGFYIVRHRTASTDKVETGLFAGKIPYIRGGSGPKHAVVFFGVNALFKPLNQASKPGRYAEQIAKLLPEGFRFTILGYEETPPDHYTLDTVVSDMASVMRSEIGKPDVVIGVSLGGFVAQRFAAEHPNLVGRLILLVSSHRFSEEGWAAVQRQFKVLEAWDPVSFVADNALLFRRPWYNWLVRVKLWMDSSSLGSEFKDPRIILQSYRSLFSADFSRNAEFVRRISAPTLVIGGTADQFFSTQGFQETAAMIPGGQVELFDGETHMLPIERSGDVAGAIEKFLILQGAAR